MNNMLSVTIYLVSLVFTAGALISVLSRKTRIAEERLFVLLSAMIMGWTILYIIWDLIENTAMLRFCYSLFYPFIAFIPPILLTLTNSFYRVKQKIPRAFLVPIFIIPSLITVMALSSNHHDLIFRTFEVISVAPVREVLIEYGPGFWFHTIFCYIMTIASIGLIVFYFFRTPEYNRYSLILFAAGIAVSLLGNVFTLLHAFPISLDPTVLFANISVAFYYFAIVNNTKFFFINFSRQWIFEQIDDIILILDTADTVVDCNDKARKWFKDNSIEIGRKNISGIMQNFREKTYHYFEDHNPEEEHIDYLYEKEQRLYIFFKKKNAIIDSRKNTIGYVVVFYDVTQSRLLQEKLEKRAGLDALTGVNNRTAFERVRKEFDGGKYLPLGIVVCDINGLKKINDSKGHSAGDMMIKDTASVLEQCCPPKGFFARFGGDEFVYLLPNTNEAAVSGLMDSAKQKLAETKSSRYGPSVAMGMALKNSEEENFNDVFILADQNMYEEKRAGRLKR